MGELQQEYGDRVELVVVSAEDTAQRAAELEEYHLTSRGHGLVAFTRSGEAVVIIAGHQFGKAEIEMAIAQVVDS